MVLTWVLFWLDLIVGSIFMINEKKLREEGVFHLDEDLDVLEEMGFSEDNVFSNFTNHRMYPESSNVFQVLETVKVSDMKTAEGSDLGLFLENLVLNEL